MNKQELIEKVKEIGIYGLNIFGTVVEGIPTKIAIELIKQLDEPETGHADEAPRYVKNILARLRELPLHDREVWLKAIMSEFEQDFSRAKWREGYEQGKFEGEWVGQQLKDADKIRRELNKPPIPQFVADWIEVCKEHLTTSLYTAMNPSFMRENNQSFDLALWIKNKSNQETFALAWILGYEVEEEKRYRISMPKARNYKNHAQFLCEKDGKMFWCAEWHRFRTKFTHKELEDADFGWVFDCQGVEVEEVE